MQRYKKNIFQIPKHWEKQFTRTKENSYLFEFSINFKNSLILFKEAVIRMKGGHTKYWSLKFMD